MTSAPAPETSTVSSRLPELRTAVVTGAGGPAGIGRVTAQVLAENGWHVALVDINADGLSGVEKELRASGHENLLAVRDGEVYAPPSPKRLKVMRAVGPALMVELVRSGAPPGA